jgi:hypothetical protein
MLALPSGLRKVGKITRVSMQTTKERGTKLDFVNLGKRSGNTWIWGSPQVKLCCMVKNLQPIMARHARIERHCSMLNPDVLHLPRNARIAAFRCPLSQHACPSVISFDEDWQCLHSSMREALVILSSGEEARAPLVEAGEPRELDWRARPGH